MIYAKLLPLAKYLSEFVSMNIIVLTSMPGATLCFDLLDCLSEHMCARRHPRLHSRSGVQDSVPVLTNITTRRHVILLALLRLRMLEAAFGAAWPFDIGHVHALFQDAWTSRLCEHELLDVHAMLI